MNLQRQIDRAFRRPSDQSSSHLLVPNTSVSAGRLIHQRRHAYARVGEAQREEERDSRRPRAWSQPRVSMLPIERLFRTDREIQRPFGGRLVGTPWSKALTRRVSAARHWRRRTKENVFVGKFFAQSFKRSEASLVCFDENVVLERRLHFQGKARGTFELNALAPVGSPSKSPPVVRSSVAHQCRKTRGPTTFGTAFLAKVDAATPSCKMRGSRSPRGALALSTRRQMDVRPGH